MSRAALWRQEAKNQERQQKSQEAWENAVLEGGNKPTKNLVPLQCPGDSFNLNKILLMNSKKSPYFLKLCNEVKNWSQAVDEIYYKADHLEQWSVV
mmetsp:Transcript_1501/g.2204  ORF Transcript_1501/g.2204 Transcript_1501/m.2204 type:complete len:96 (-) Transcript_1501:948-1235(-)